MSETDPAPEPREPLAAPSSYAPVPTNRIFPAWERYLKFGWIGAIAIAAIAGYRYYKAQQPEPMIRLAVFPAATPFPTGGKLTLSPTISADGKLAAYSSDRDGSGALAIWTQAVDSETAARVTSGEYHDTDPDISPDGKWIAYRSERGGGGIYVVPVAGGPPRLLVKDGWKPRFSPDGEWIAYSTLTASSDFTPALGVGQAHIIAAGGGEPRAIAADFSYARYPVWSPDGKHLLFLGARADGTRDWWVVPSQGGKAVRTRAVEALLSTVRTLPVPDSWRGGRIVFSAPADGRPHLWEATISPDFTVVKAPRRITDGAAIEQHPALSGDGRVLFARVAAASEVWSIPIAADEARVTGEWKAIAAGKLPSAARNAGKIVFSSEKSGAPDAWVSDLDGASDESVTAFRDIGYRPVISADGGRIAYPTRSAGVCAVIVQPASRAPGGETLPGCFGIWDWSPDAATLLTFRSAATLRIVEAVSVPAGGRRTALSHPSQSLYNARYSPDGKWIAFAAGFNSGQARVYLAPARDPAPGEKEWIAISGEWSGEPAWSPDGATLYYRSRRDGFECIWASKLDAARRPSGEPAAVLHLHSASLGLYLTRPVDFGMSVTRDRLILNLSKTTGTLWSLKL